MSDDENQEPQDAAGEQVAEAQDSVATAQFDNLQDDSLPISKDHPGIDVILDIPVSISMEIGRSTISIRDLLQLNQGSVVELDRLAGEPLDVLVNGKLLAFGEVVVVDDKFGIRLTDIVSASERIEQLK